MITQLIYWKSVCTDCRRTHKENLTFDAHSRQEKAAFLRALRRLKQRKFLRYH